MRTLQDLALCIWKLSNDICSDKDDENHAKNTEEHDIREEQPERPIRNRRGPERLG